MEVAFVVDVGSRLLLALLVFELLFRRLPEDGLLAGLIVSGDETLKCCNDLEKLAIQS